MVVLQDGCAEGSWSSNIESPCYCLATFVNCSYCGLIKKVKCICSVLSGTLPFLYGPLIHVYARRVVSYVLVCLFEVDIVLKLLGRFVCGPIDSVGHVVNH